MKQRPSELKSAEIPTKVQKESSPKKDAMNDGKIAADLWNTTAKVKMQPHGSC